MIQRWGRFRIQAGEGTQAMFVFEELLREMRKDLGHNDESLKQGDLLRVFHQRHR